MNLRWLELFARGVPIFESEAIEHMRESHRQERKWAHRKMYKKWERFKITKSFVVISVGGALYANPKTVRAIEAAIK